SGGRDALRLPRPVVYLSDGGARAPRRPGGRERPGDPRPSRQRREPGRRARRAGDRHEHGLHPGVGLDDEHPHRRPRSGARLLPGAHRGDDRRRLSIPGQRRVRPARRLGVELRPARPARSRGRGRARGGGRGALLLPGEEVDRLVRRGARGLGHPRLRGRHRRERAARARAHLRRPRLSRDPNRPGAQRGRCGEDLSGRGPGRREGPPHRRRADDCALGPPDARARERAGDRGESMSPGNPTRDRTLDAEELRKLDAYWRAANYLSVGQLYLLANPLLRQPLEISHVKPNLLGHWGTTPGLSFIYVHLNRIIRKYDLDMIFVTGPGHGGPALVANTYLEGTYSEIYPEVSRDEAGLARLCRQFSFPGGIPSHVSPECPGSIHEGGELGYSLSHAFGAVFDNPGLMVACVVGDGEAETGPLATAWHSNKFLDAATDGA